MSSSVEQSSYFFFEGNQWWVYELFVYKGEQYAYLLREEPLRISYAKVAGPRDLTPVPNDLKQKLAERYQQILIIRINQEGKEAIPRVGKVLTK
jgi:hypothetical protein